MTISGNNLIIPDSSVDALILADANSGAVIWRQSIPFFPLSNAVLHGSDIFLVGSYSNLPGYYFEWYTIDGTYRGRILIGTNGGENPNSEQIHLIGDAIFWGDRGYSDTDPSGDLWRFDLTQPLTLIGDHLYAATADGLKIMYHKSNPDINVIGGQVLGIGSDVVFTYADSLTMPMMHFPTTVVRLNAGTGAVVWEYQTAKARSFWWNDLILAGDKIVANGSLGVELIDATSPGTMAPFWAYDDTLHENFDTGLVVGNILFEVSMASATAVRAYSMTDGSELWCLPNTTSVGQGAQYNNGVLYVSEQEGVLAVDTAKGKWIGRDDSRPGYIDQVSNTLAYNNLFIYFSNQTNPKGRIEALTSYPKIWITRLMLRNP